MGRKASTTLDYIQLDCTDKTTLKRLHRKYGKEGRLFWYELLRLLGRTENYILNLSDEWMCEDILEGELFVEKAEGLDMLNCLAEWGCICKKTWEEHRNIWCQNLIDRHMDVFKKRNKIPGNPFESIISDTEKAISARKKTEKDISDTESTQSKVKESKVKEDEKEKEFSSSPTTEDVFFSIEKLSEEYLTNDRVLSAVSKNLNIPIEHIKSRMKDFVQHLEANKQFAKTETDFASHFRHWLNKQKSNQQQPGSNIPIG